MTREEASDILANIVRAWTTQIASYPPEVQAAQTTLVVLRQHDIEAMRVAIADLTKPEVF
jgi:hypothetical protein